jgi:hypothetical protein
MLITESSTFVEEVLRPAFQRDVRGVSLDDICRFATNYIGSPAIVIDSQVLITYDRINYQNLIRAFSKQNDI